MRLLLDAQLSHRFVAAPLRARGHDVLSLQEERALDALRDADVLALAASESRIVVTRNSKDFSPLLRRWAEGGQEHAGCILIWSYEHGSHGEIVGGLERLFAELPRQEDWKNLARAL